jgi:regulatory protein
MSELNEKLLRYGFWLLGRKEYSEKELRTKFKEKEYNQDDINKVISYYQSNNYQSDARFTRMFINSKISKMGISKLKSKLSFEKGINKDTIDEVLAELELSEIDNVIKLVETRFKNKDLKDHKEKSKAVRYLASKGFSFDDINNAISIVLENK